MLEFEGSENERKSGAQSRLPVESKAPQKVPQSWRTHKHLRAITAGNEFRMNYPVLISHTWLGMLAVLITMLIVDVLSHAMRGDYQGLSATLGKDPGPTGLRVLVCMICFNALIQAFVHTSSGGPFRLMILVLSVLYTAFFVVHQVIHLLAGEKPGLHSILDLTHHALGFLAIWAAWLWINVV